MKLHSNSVIKGVLIDACGARGTEILQKKMPTRSFHLAWQDLPKGTVTLALTFVDHDAIPACGFTWIHWSVANIDPKLGELPENASRTMHLLEGVNSWASGLLPETIKLSSAEATAYGGCAPPDREHQYTIEMYALDTQLKLAQGFYLNELWHAMEGHVLGKATLLLRYPQVISG